VRILIFHGYLLAGTGSNVYNARLAEALVRLGHEVHLLSQERHPERLGLVSASGVWEDGSLRLRSIRPGSCTVYRPDIGGLLPVYVQDRYEGLEARTFLDCSEAQVDAYLHANVQAVREVAQLAKPDLALANHLIMGPVILARALEGSVPYAVKVHGSALEYTVKRDPQRFLAFAREGLAGSSAVLVGSRHTAESLWEALADPTLPRRTRLGPPGVDVRRFSPHPRAEGIQSIEGLARRLRRRSQGAPGSGGQRGGEHDELVNAKQDKATRQVAGRVRERASAFARDEQASESARDEQASTFARDEQAVADALDRLAGEDGELVAFVGKLIVSKGVDLLLAAWPLVLQSRPRARLAIVGFGAYRKALERLLRALSWADMQGAREIALAGRALEADAGAGPLEGALSRPLHHLLAFLDSLAGARLERYEAAAVALSARVTFTGRLDHDELADVLPACCALVVPSTFPEAFGMVAAEAAACGVPPISARHSGLAEVSDALASALPREVVDWLSFPVDDLAVESIAERVLAWLDADPRLLVRSREQLVQVARNRWSWEGVAGGVMAAAQGQLDRLTSVEQVEPSAGPGGAL
jgi:glycosyltransferase involved in cell wall biosynthesis